MNQYRPEDFMDAFIEETIPLAERVGRLFLQLEAMNQEGWNPEAIWPELRSDLHTIKGNAGMMEKDLLKDLAKNLEDVILIMTENNRTVGPDLSDLLLRGADLMVELIPMASPNGVTIEEAKLLGVSLIKTAEQTPHQDIAPQKKTKASWDPPKVLSMDVKMPLAALEALEKQVEAMLERANELVNEKKPPTPVGADGLTAQLFAKEQARDLEILQSMILEAKQMALGTLFERYVRPVRDMARAQGKGVRLDISGQSIRINRSGASALGEALVHLLRNAVDHGLELPGVRRNRGKGPVGQISLDARIEAGFLILEVVDDGNGLDRKRIRTRAKDLNLDVTGFSSEQLDRLIFRPGFTTRNKVTDLSGRGIGLDVVVSRIEAMGGQVEVLSTPEKGTLFRLTLPR